MISLCGPAGERHLDQPHPVEQFGVVLPLTRNLRCLVSNQAQLPVSEWPGIVWADLVGVANAAPPIDGMARPVKGVGLTAPALLAPIAGAEVAAILKRIGGQSASACVIAYVSGTLGTPVGAGRTNMKKIAGLRAPVAPICGAGTLGGVFLTGVIAALLASS